MIKIYTSCIVETNFHKIYTTQYLDYYFFLSILYASYFILLFEIDIP